MTQFGPGNNGRLKNLSHNTELLEEKCSHKHQGIGSLKKASVFGARRFGRTEPYPTHVYTKWLIVFILLACRDDYGVWVIGFGSRGRGSSVGIVVDTRYEGS